MRTRALIIAIEKYSNATDVGTTLPGVIRAASRFRSWLHEELNVQDEDIVVCSGFDSHERTFDDSIYEIRKGVAQILEFGRDCTDRLFIFVAGHGVTVADRGIDDDYLLTSDFVNVRESGSCCVPIAGLADLLARTMGPGEHIWFVDMCRTNNVTLAPSGLGISPKESSLGQASQFTLFSTGAGMTAPNDNQFVDALMSALAGNCQLVNDEDEAGVYQVRFQSVAEVVSQELQSKGRETYHRAAGSKNDLSIRTIRQAGPTATIIRDGGFKSPRLKLLTDFDELIFLGETLGQLPSLVKQAFSEHRAKRRWRSIELFSIKNLSNAFRADVSPTQLNSERDEMEEYFRSAAAEITDVLRLYRYDYVGTYASLWRADDGRRRVHLSSGVMGEDIRRSAITTDYVDFPEAPLATIDSYYSIVTNLRNDSDRCSLVFDYARSVANG